MIDKNSLMIRYLGGANRTFIIQRGDRKYWTGKGWIKSIDRAKVYMDHKAAQTACVALHHERYQGKPMRTFKLAVNITVIGDQIEKITKSKLARFLAKAVRIDVDTVHGDGPDGAFVQARLSSATLQETASQSLLALMAAHA